MTEDAQTKLSFRAIEVFVAVVEERSVSGAAKRLGGSVSAVSLQLSNLEKSLGVRLIERNSRQFSLTAQGDAFLPRAIRILDEVAAAAASLSSVGAASRVLLNIAMIEDFDQFVLPAWLCRISEELGAYRFNIKSGMSHENYSALSNRSADLIVAMDAVERADWVEEHPVLRDPYVLVVSQTAAAKKTMPDLSASPFIRYSRDLLIGRQIEAQLRRNKTVPAREHEFSSNQAVFAMAEQLGGWTISSLSAFLGSFSQAKPNTLILRALPMPAFSRRISLYARRNALGELPAQFSECLRSTLSETLLPAFDAVASGDESIPPPRILD